MYKIFTAILFTVEGQRQTSVQNEQMWFQVSVATEQTTPNLVPQNNVISHNSVGWLGGFLAAFISGSSAGTFS